MSKSVENPTVAPKAAEETPKKKFPVTRKHVIVAATTAAAVGAVVAVVRYQVKASELQEAAEAAKETLLEIAVDEA